MEEEYNNLKLKEIWEIQRNNIMVIRDGYEIELVFPNEDILLLLTLTQLYQINEYIIKWKDDGEFRHQSYVLEDVNNNREDYLILHHDNKKVTFKIESDYINKMLFKKEEEKAFNFEVNDENCMVDTKDIFIKTANSKDIIFISKILNTILNIDKNLLINLLSFDQLSCDFNVITLKINDLDVKIIINNEGDVIMFDGVYINKDETTKNIYDNINKLISIIDKDMPNQFELINNELESFLKTI